MGEAGGRDLAPIITGVAAAQRVFAGRQAHRDPAQLGQHPVDVEQAGRLHGAGDHQVPEDLVGHDIEAQIEVHPGQRVEQQPDGSQYVVFETKGTTDLQLLRPVERGKILAAQRHFNRVRVDIGYPDLKYAVVYDMSSANAALDDKRPTTWCPWSSARRW